jgi:hypothetical protein
MHNSLTTIATEIERVLKEQQSPINSYLAVAIKVAIRISLLFRNFVLNRKATVSNLKLQVPSKS